MKVTKADGAIEICSAYNKFELKRIIEGRPARKRVYKKPPPLKLKQDKKGLWVVYGPRALMAEGIEVNAKDRSGKWHKVKIERIGRPFPSGAHVYAYGYLLEPPIIGTGPMRNLVAKS